MARSSSSVGRAAAEGGGGPDGVSDLPESAPRAGAHPALIATFVVVALIGALIGWLALSDGVEVPASGVSLSIEAAQNRAVEELAAPVAPVPDVAQVAESAGAAGAKPRKRVLPTSLGEGGRIQLGPVPDPRLVEQSPSGPLPRIASDGAQAWHVYSHPFPASDTRPRIAVIVGGMGLSGSTTAFALKRLPAQISFSFTPYAKGLQEWVDGARKAGHELLLELPMEPYDFPENDPGPYALLTDLSAIENTNRLEWLMARFTGYIGVINFLGAKFTTADAVLGPVIAELKGRGLMIVDDNSTRRSLIGDLAGQVEMPFVRSDRQIDGVPAAEQIDAKLAELEELALKQGHALGVGFSYPVTIDRVAVWAARLESKGIALVPVSALAGGPGS